MSPFNFSVKAYQAWFHIWQSFSRLLDQVWDQLLLYKKECKRYLHDQLKEK